MKNYKNKNAFALIIAMGMVLFMVLIVFFILEYMIPFSRNTKGIENASKAYYQAESAIEDVLLNDYDLSYAGASYDSSDLTYKSKIVKQGSVMPPVVDGIPQGNSEYDSNFNIIRSGEPIQLDVGNGKLNLNANNFDICFKVPDLGFTQSFDSNDSSAIISWQLSSGTNSLNPEVTPTGENYIKYQDIGSSNSDCSSILKTLDGLDGINLDGEEDSFLDFYDDNCGPGKDCTLKLSVVNDLILDNGVLVPYVEWKIDVGTDTIPLRYKIIEASGKSYGYRKDLKVKVPQQTVNEAFDFTVFQ